MDGICIDIIKCQGKISEINIIIVQTVFAFSNVHLHYSIKFNQNVIFSDVVQVLASLSFLSVQSSM